MPVARPDDIEVETVAAEGSMETSPACSGMSHFLSSDKMDFAMALSDRVGGRLGRSTFLVLPQAHQRAEDEDAGEVPAPPSFS